MYIVYILCNLLLVLSSVLAVLAHAGGGVQTEVQYGTSGPVHMKKKPRNHSALCAATCVDLGSSGYMIRIRIYVDDNGPTEDRQRMTDWLVIYVGVTRRRQGKERVEEEGVRTGQRKTG